MYVCNRLLKWKAHKELITPLYEKLEKGTSFGPSTTEDMAYIVPRPEHIASLTRWFF